MNYFFSGRDMKTTYLDYYKTILDKVSFDHQLFRKEYAKALRQLPEPDQSELNQWLQIKGLLTLVYFDTLAKAS